MNAYTLSPLGLLRLARWDRSHGVAVDVDSEHGCLIVYSEAVHHDGRVETVVDSVRTLAEARTLLGY